LLVRSINQSKLSHGFGYIQNRDAENSEQDCNYFQICRNTILPIEQMVEPFPGEGRRVQHIGHLEMVAAVNRVSGALRIDRRVIINRGRICNPNERKIGRAAGRFCRIVTHHDAIRGCVCDKREVDLSYCGCRCRGHEIFGRLARIDRNLRTRGCNCFHEHECKPVAPRGDGEFPAAGGFPVSAQIVSRDRQLPRAPGVIEREETCRLVRLLRVYHVIVIADKVRRVYACILVDWKVTRDNGLSKNHHLNRESDMTLGWGPGRKDGNDSGNHHKDNYPDDDGPFLSPQTGNSVLDAADGPKGLFDALMATLTRRQPQQAMPGLLTGLRGCLPPEMRHRIRTPAQRDSVQV